jgi:catechol 2,3-dioxygenase-like lactoylglutathione lyase family enzyme
MTSIKAVTLQVPDPAAARKFYKTAFGLGTQIRVQQADEQTSGFRGFTLSLLVDGPTTAEGLLTAAIEGGAYELKAATKSFWGYGGAVQAPDGTVVTVAASSKRDKGPASHKVDQILLLLGATDVAASKSFYVERGFTIGRSVGSKYADFKLDGSPIGFAINARATLAKNAHVEPDGDGSHCLIIHADAGPFTDPDGFSWQVNKR